MISQRGGTTNCRIAYPLAYTEKWLCKQTSTTCKQLIESTMRKHKDPICQQMFPLKHFLYSKDFKNTKCEPTAALYCSILSPIFKTYLHEATGLSKLMTGFCKTVESKQKYTPLV